MIKILLVLTFLSFSAEAQHLRYHTGVFADMTPPSFSDTTPYISFHHLTHDNWNRNFTAEEALNHCKNRLDLYLKRLKKAETSILHAQCRGGVWPSTGAYYDARIYLK